MLSFSVAHAFVVEENHSKIEVHECAVEFEHHSHSDPKHNHVFHCEFHNVYILSDNSTLQLSEKVYILAAFIPKFHTYFHPNKLIKPPIA